MRITLSFLFLFGCLLLNGASAKGQQAFLSNEAYREQVKAYNQGLKQQQLRMEMSRRNRKIARSEYFPKIDIQAEGTLNLNQLKAWHEPLGQYRNHTYQGIFTLSQPLYQGGSTVAHYQRARTNEQLSAWGWEKSLEELQYESDALYWQASACHALLQASRDYQEIIRQQYALIRDRFENGKVSRTDLLMISTRLQEAEVQLIQAREQRTLSFQQLNIARGIAPTAPCDSLAPIQTPTTAPLPCSLTEVLLRKPDYQASLLQIDLRRQERKEAMSQFLPRVDFFFHGGWATATPNLGYDVSFNPIVGLKLRLPLFRGGSRWQTSRCQRAAIALQEWESSLVCDHIQQELAAARTRVEESQVQVEAAQKNLQLATENLQLVTFSYREGKVSLMDVLTSQDAWIHSSKNLIHTQLAEKIALAAYQKVTNQH